MYIWWMLIPNITSFEGVFWPLKSIALTFGGLQTSTFLTFLETLGEYSFLKKTSGHATMQKPSPFKPFAVLAYHLLHAHRPLKLCLPLHGQKSYKEEQICSSWMTLGVFLICVFTQNLLFVLVCVHELFRERRDFSFTYLSCKVFVLNFRLKG